MGHKNLVVSDPSASYPDFLKKVKKSTSGKEQAKEPVVIRMQTKSARADLESLLKRYPEAEVIDNYAEQYAELLLSKNAHLYRANYEVQVASIEKLLDEHYGGKQPWTLGSWIFYPWNNQLVHILAQDDFEALRTIRNRDLITNKEQEKLFDFEAVVFGMSVGSASALALGISGISRKIKLVDGAVISGSNLNRILTGVSSVGRGKALVIGREIYEMNPYSTVSYFDKVMPENIDEIFDKPWPVRIAIDEIDDIEMKVRIRHEARKRKLPVLMATEIGDTVIIDVERFDLEPDRPLFHGMVPGIEQLLERKVENYREWTKHAVRIIDPHNMSVKMQQSLLKIGTTIVTHPQLGSTVMMTGGVLAFAVKNIALGHTLKSGRYVISLEKEMLADHQGRKYKRHHKKHTKVIHSAVSAM
jgi:hypothetical protein